MKIIDLLSQNTLSISFEVFPPKTETSFESVRAATEEIAKLRPAFMSVTYGAGGGTGRYTLDIAKNIKEKFGVSTLAHLTCVSSTRETVRRQIEHIKAAGIENTSGLAIIQNKQVHMAYLAMYGSFAVNGVARIHSEILKDDVLHAWYELRPEMFQNKTNGITQRRWLGLCNPELCQAISSRIGDGYLTDLYELEKLKPLIETDEALIREFIQVKKEKTKQLSACIEKHEKIHIPA
ncbi:MAG: glycogen/starch/alpha-glucan phosphorylase, partial [Clostridia bacterium]|nr:glycogen/starch/alpha-glucan phosphorylase [Clostridia bacterium]